MTTLSMLLAATLALGTGSANESETVSGDLAQIQGAWKTLAGPDHNVPVALEIQGRQVTVHVSMPKGLKIQAKGEVILDETAEPKALDWVNFVALDDQDLPEIQAIYQIDGDTLRICNGGPNNSRPSEFKAGDGSLADDLIFTRSPSQE